MATSQFTTRPEQDRIHAAERVLIDRSRANGARLAAEAELEAMRCRNLVDSGVVGKGSPSKGRG